MTLPGGFELLIHLGFLLPICGAIDAALIPNSRWRLADQSKAVWVILQLVGVYAWGVGGLIASTIYFVVVRPKLNQSRDRISP